MSVKRFIETLSNKDITVNIIDSATNELIETITASDECIINEYKTVKEWSIITDYTTSIEVLV